MPQNRNLMQELNVTIQSIVDATNPPIANGPPAGHQQTGLGIINLDGVTFAGNPTGEAAPAAGSGEFDTATLARQSSLALAIPQTVAIVGCGGVGSWIAYFLALAGVPELLLFDSDTVSETNLNRMPYGQTVTSSSHPGVGVVGSPKTDVLKRFLLERRPRLTVECHPNLTPDFAKALNLHRKEGLWLAVSTDTWASRTAIYKWSAHYGIDYIEASAEGDFGSIALSPADWATPLEENPGYASVPVWVGPCTSAATMACSYILHRNNAGRDVSARFGWADDAIRFNYHSEKPPATAGKEVA